MCYIICSVFFCSQLTCLWLIFFRGMFKYLNARICFVLLSCLTITFCDLCAQYFRFRMLFTNFVTRTQKPFVVIVLVHKYPSRCRLAATAGGIANPLCDVTAWCRRLFYFSQLFRYVCSLTLFAVSRFAARFWFYWS